MAVYEILPEANLSMDDVRDTLNANGGSVGNDLVSYFSASANINKWAKYKPEDYKKNFNLTDDERKSNHYGLTMNAYQYLLNASSIIAKDGKIDISNDKNSFLYKLCKGTLGQFDYVLPKGGENSPYRLGDFRRYKFVPDAWKVR